LRSPANASPESFKTIRLYISSRVSHIEGASCLRHNYLKEMTETD
jgi:hypothetical protein